MKNIFLTLFTIVLLSSCGNQPTEAESTSENQQKNGQLETTQHTPRTALDSVNQLVSNDPLNAEKLAIRAKVYLKQNNVTAARADINKAFSIDSNVAVVREARGELHYMVNRGPAAIQDWEACVKLDPENINCLQSLSELYIALQNYDRAMEMVNRQLTIDDKDPQAYFMKGIIVRDKLNDTALALQYFQNAVDLKQDYIDALDMLGVTLANRGDTLAPFYYQRILEYQPNRYDIYYKLGAYYMKQHEENRALESFTKAVQINPADAESYFSMGYINLELSQYANARDYFTKAINARDRNYKAYYGRGYSFEMLGDVLNAQKDYQKAIEILPMYTPAQEALARVKQ